MNDTLISIIIPTYNRVDLISKAIESVFKQTYQNFEIIVVDDGSTDGTKEYMESVNYKKIKYIRIKNSGVSIARNKGIELSSGEYVAFLDSDDYWIPEKLEKQLLLFKSDRDLCMLYSNFCYVDNDGRENSEPALNLPKNNKIDYTKVFLDGGCFPYPSTVMLKKKGLSGIKFFDKSLIQSEDLDFWLRISFDKKIRFIDENLAKIRIHSGNTTKSRVDVWLGVLRVIRKNSLVLKQKGFDLGMYYSKFYLMASRASLFEGNRFMAFIFCFKAFYYFPFDRNFLKGIIKIFLPIKYLKKRNKKYLSNKHIPEILQDYY